jgi:hypothetical protein
MPLCFRICHCVAPGPFLAAALLFLPENLVGSDLACGGGWAEGLPRPQDGASGAEPRTDLLAAARVAAATPLDAKLAAAG